MTLDEQLKSVDEIIAECKREGWNSVIPFWEKTRSEILTKINLHYQQPQTI